MGQYNGYNWLDTSEDMSPDFDAESRKWYFDGTREDIEKLLSEVVLTHERGPKKGQRIVPDDVNIYNDGDPLFNHSVFKRETEKSKLTLDLEDPIDRFLNLCLISPDDVLRPSEDNPAIADDTRYEVHSAGSQEKREVRNTNLKMEATAVIQGLGQKKLLSLCRALNHPTFYPLKDLSETSLKATAYQILVEEGADMKDKNGKLYLETLIDYSKLTLRELEIKQLLAFAYKKGVISKRRDGNYYLFRDRDNSEIIEDILDDNNLYEKLLSKDGIELKNGEDLLAFLHNRFAETE